MSYFGGLIIAGAALLIVFAIIGELTIAQPSPYVGIFTYLIFPGILFSGVLLVLYGMRRESLRRRRTGSKGDPYPRVDLNDERHRKRFGLVLVVGGVLSVIVAWVGYNGYILTGSNTFCGEICHTVMEPEYTAYQGSAHAKVPCVDCHVGSGASWYVQSKISGVRQVFAASLETYDRPIKTPIAHLRPARDTCEHCHWPEKFYGATLFQIPHFRYDEQNSEEQISLLLRTGGGNPEDGRSSGIHWHMIVDNVVTFAAEDKKLQQIPWIKVEHRDGTVIEYKLEGTELNDVQLEALPRHTMDCMDCHNRPSHNFPPPDRSMDEALARGQVSKALPWIKKVAVDALVRPFKEREEAHKSLESDIRGFYQEKYPEILQAKVADINQAIEVAKGIYDRGIFPKMNVDWKTYPNNIGHRYWPGCFRCHDNRHVSDDGKRLTADCNSCHTEPKRGAMGELGDIPDTQNGGWHPWEMPKEYVKVEAHSKLLCYQCHEAGYRPRKVCADCHR